MTRPMVPHAGTFLQASYPGQVTVCPFFPS